MSYERGSGATRKSSCPTEIPTGHDKKVAAGVDAQTRPTNLPLPLAPTDQFLRPATAKWLPSLGNLLSERSGTDLFGLWAIFENRMTCRIEWALTSLLEMNGQTSNK